MVRKETAEILPSEAPKTDRESEQEEDVNLLGRPVQVGRWSALARPWGLPKLEMLVTLVTAIATRGVLRI